MRIAFNIAATFALLPLVSFAAFAGENPKRQVQLRAAEARQAELLQMIARLQAEIARNRVLVDRNRPIADKLLKESTARFRQLEGGQNAGVAAPARESVHADLKKLKSLIAELKKEVARQRDRADKHRLEAEAAHRRAQEALRQAHGRQHGEQRRADPREHIRRAEHRFENIRAAAKHLHEAGLPDLARAAEEQGKKLEKEIHAARQPHHHQADAHVRELTEAVMQLRKQVQELKKAVGDLQRKR